MTEASQVLLVLVTAPDPDAAVAIARAVVDERLAACASVVPGLTSVFNWEGKREEAPETLLLIKTDATRYRDLEQRVLALHPYSVPEVLAVPVRSGAPAYLRWLRESVGA